MQRRRSGRKSQTSIRGVKAQGRGARRSWGAGWGVPGRLPCSASSVIFTAVFSQKTYSHPLKEG